MGFVGALELALELQIVGRIGEHQIDRAGLKLRHLGDAIADDDAGALQGTRNLCGAPLQTPRDATQP